MYSVAKPLANAVRVPESAKVDAEFFLHYRRKKKLEEIGGNWQKLRLVTDIKAVDNENFMILAEQQYECSGIAALPVPENTLITPPTCCYCTRDIHRMRKL